MTPDKIKLLLESYYAGDISPDDYEILLSTMREAKNLPPELENECRMLLTVDSYEPVMPDGLEKMLDEAIDKRFRKSHNTLIMLLSGAAAAVLIICITIGMLKLINNKDLSDSEYIAESAGGHKEPLPDALPTAGTASEFEKISESIETKSADKAVPLKSMEEYAVPEMSDEEIDKAAKIVDESLLDLLSTIHEAQNEVAKSLENIQTNHTTDINN